MFINLQGCVFSSVNYACKVLQTDNERTLHEMSEELRITRSELEEKRSLTEKLEMDLLQMDQHKPNGLRDSGTATPSDVLSDLDIGGKRSNNVSCMRQTVRRLSEDIAEGHSREEHTDTFHFVG